MDMNYERKQKDVCFFSFNFIKDFFDFDSGYMYRIYLC